MAHASPSRRRGASSARNAAGAAASSPSACGEASTCAPTAPASVARFHSTKTEAPVPQKARRAESGSSWAIAIAAPDRGLARLAFLAGGASIFVVWNLTTVVGSLGAAALSGAALAALDAVVPAAFLALLWPRLQPAFPEAAVQRRVAVGGAVVALALTPFVPAGVQVIAAVVAVGLAGRPRRPAGTA